MRRQSIQFDWPMDDSGNEEIVVRYLGIENILFIFLLLAVDPSKEPSNPGSSWET